MKIARNHGFIFFAFFVLPVLPFCRPSSLDEASSRTCWALSPATMTPAPTSWRQSSTLLPTAGWEVDDDIVREEEQEEDEDEDKEKGWDLLSRGQRVTSSRVCAARVYFLFWSFRCLQMTGHSDSGPLVSGIGTPIFRPAASSFLERTMESRTRKMRWRKERCSGRASRAMIVSPSGPIRAPPPSSALLRSLVIQSPPPSSAPFDT